MSENMPRSIRLQVITLEGELVRTEVDEVTLPGLDGYLGILPGHQPLLTALGEGTITYRRDKKEDSFLVRGGYAEIYPEKVLVFTELSKDETDQQTQG